MQESPFSPLKNYAWARELKASIVVCDKAGIIVEMNDTAGEMFAKSGGKALIGKSLLDCHPEHAKKKLLALIEARKTNVYTIEKNGVKKLLYQEAWYEQGVYAGFVEIGLTLPDNLPHFIRS